MIGPKTYFSYPSKSTRCQLIFTRHAVQNELSLFVLTLPVENMLKFSSFKSALLLALFALGACSSLGIDTDPTYSNPEKEKLYKNGSLLSDSGGSEFLNGKITKNNDNNGVGLGVKVSLFRQTRGVSGNWMDAPINPATATQLEETILTRARQLRITQKEAN